MVYTTCWKCHFPITILEKEYDKDKMTDNYCSKLYKKCGRCQTTNYFGPYPFCVRLEMNKNPKTESEEQEAERQKQYEEEQRLIKEEKKKQKQQTPTIRYKLFKRIFD